MGRALSTRPGVRNAYMHPALICAATVRIRAQIATDARRRAPYEYPREIEFIDALPMTTTGKVQRKELRRREEAKAR